MENEAGRGGTPLGRTVTLHDVARELGITHVTVHNALNGKGRMSAELRERVQNTARELGYRPHPLARGLRQGRAHALGVVVYQLHSRLAPPQLAGVEEAAQERGYNIVVAAHQQQPERALAILRDMTARRLDGVVSISSISTLQPGLAQKLPELGLPYIFSFHEPPAGLAADGVTVEQEGGAYQATKHLLSLGRRKLAFISGPTTRMATVLRLAGFRRAHAELGLEPDESRIILAGDFEVEDGVWAAEELLRRAPDSDAVFAAADLLAAPVMRALRRSGRRMPEDVAVIGFDDLPVSAGLDPALSTVRMPLHEIGRRCANRLIDRIESSGDWEPRVERLECELVLRESA
jgi:LacI family transcriptional regulator